MVNPPVGNSLLDQDNQESFMSLAQEEQSSSYMIPFKDATTFSDQIGTQNEAAKEPEQHDSFHENSSSKR